MEKKLRFIIFLKNKKVVGATTWLKNRFTNVSFKDFDEKLVVLNVIRQYDQWLQMLENSKKTSIRQFAFSTHFDKLSSYLINCFNRFFLFF